MEKTFSKVFYCFVLLSAVHFELLLYATKNPIFMICIFTENLQSRHFITILASPISQKTSQTFPEIKEYLKKKR